MKLCILILENYNTNVVSSIESIPLFCTKEFKNNFLASQIQNCAQLTTKLKVKKLKSNK